MLTIEQGYSFIFKSQSAKEFMKIDLGFEIPDNLRQTICVEFLKIDFDVAMHFTADETTNFENTEINFHQPTLCHPDQRLIGPKIIHT